MIEKDFRALLPLWLACAASLVVAHQAGRNWEWLGVAAYVLGAPAIGALAIGHEYTHRTLGMLLTLPVPRWRIWTSKVVVAALFIAGLTGIARYVGPLRGSGGGEELAFFLLTALAGIFISGWLTMLSRNPLAGTVFTIEIAGILMLVGGWIGIRLYGYTKQVDDFEVAFMWSTMLPLCAIGAAAGWRAFAGLQAIDGRDADVRLGFGRGRRAAAAVTTRRHPAWALLLKELKLQQLAWAVAAIYALLYVGVVGLRLTSQNSENIAMVLTLLFSAMLAIILGSVAGAEERQLGTHEAQLLQPVPAGLQWFVKAGTALALAWLLTIVLPVLLATAMPPEHMRVIGRGGMIQPQTFWFVSLVVAVGLYVATLSGNPLRSLMLSVAVLVAVGVFFQRVLLPVTYRVNFAMHSAAGGRFVVHAAIQRQETTFWIVALTALLLLVLRFGAINHRNADRGAGRIAAQVAGVAIAFVAVFALAGALGIR